MLEQTFTDFEIIVSDNESTDGTAAIGQEFAARDPRVRYIRQSQNIGVSANFDFVFHEARAPLFVWHSHDDLRTADWLEHAVAAMDANPDAALGISESWKIDVDGNRTRPFDILPDLFAPSAEDRFRASLRQMPVPLTYSISRSEALRKTCLMEPYLGNDWSLNAALAVQGRFVRIDEGIYFFRIHPNSFTSRYATRKWWQRLDFEGWFAPDRAGRVVFPAWRRLRSYLRSARTAPLPLSTRLRLHATLLRTYLLDEGGYLIKQLFKDLVVAGRVLFRRFTSRRRAGRGVPAVSA